MIARRAGDTQRARHLACIGLVATIDAVLVVPLLLWLAAYLLLMWYCVPRMATLIAEYQKLYAGVSGMLVDTYSMDAPVMMRSWANAG